MSKAKPHTIALRLSPEEYRGLRYYMASTNAETMTDALRDLLPLEQLAQKVKAANDGQ